MKVRVETTLDTETGDYEMKFFNVSHPGEAMDYMNIRDMLSKVFVDFTKRIDGVDDEDLPDDIYRPVN
jgi:hypothetical protein